MIEKVSYYICISMTEEQLKTLTEEYLHPEWREMVRTKNFPEMLPVGFLDDLLDATTRMVEDNRKKSEKIDRG